MPLKKLLILIPLIFFYHSIFGQDTTISFKTRQDSVEALLKAMRYWGGFESRFTGPAGMPSRQYYRLQFLERISTNNELAKMTTDSSACIRIYAYAALAYRKYLQLKDISEKLCIDTSRISVLQGCTLSKKTVQGIIKDRNIEVFYKGTDNNGSFFNSYANNPKMLNLFFADLLWIPTKVNYVKAL